MATCSRSTVQIYYKIIRSKYCGVQFYQESTNDKQAANSATNLNTMNLNRNNCVKCNNIDTSQKSTNDKQAANSATNLNTI